MFIFAQKNVVKAREKYTAEDIKTCYTCIMKTYVTITIYTASDKMAFITSLKGGEQFPRNSQNSCLSRLVDPCSQSFGSVEI